MRSTRDRRTTPERAGGDLTLGISDDAVPRTGLSDVSEAVLAVERDLGLMDRRIHDAPFWQRVRFDLHRQLVVRSGVMGPPIPAMETRGGWLGSRVTSLRATFRRSAFGAVPECDVLFAGGGRRTSDAEWGLHAPYCGALARECGSSSIVVEFQDGSWTPAAPGVPTFNLDRMNVLAGLRRRMGSSPVIPEQTRALLSEVGRRLSGDLGVPVDLLTMVRSDLANRATGLPLCRRLLKRTGARAVVLACSYDKHTLIEAARTMDVPVVEVQHGVISRHHFGYHFPPESGSPSAFPDWLLTWGRYWDTAASFPVPGDRILPVGFPRFDRQRAAADVSDGDVVGGRSGTILFLSQAMLGETLSRFAAELAEHGLRNRIVYRLHPREEEGWRGRYPWLASAGVRTSGSDQPLYRQLRSAPIQVGTFSTALFEGLALGARLFLLRAPGIEYMEDLLRGGAAALVETPRELAERLRHVDHRGEPEYVGRAGGERDGGRSVDGGANVDPATFFRAGASPRACRVIQAIVAGTDPERAASR